MSHPHPIQRGKSLKIQVYESLKETFLSGEWNSNRLSEANLAARLGVSRTPVREALLELKREGLVSYTSKEGIRLPVLSADEVRHLYQLRWVLEDVACRQVAGRLKASQVQDIRQCLSQMLVANRKEGARSQFLRADREFHVSLAYATGNRYLAEQVAALFDRTTVAGIEDTLVPVRRSSVLDEHSRILEFLIGGNAAGAQRVMLKHLNTSRDLLAESLARRETATVR